jgi:hypothetical protein
LARGIVVIILVFALFVGGIVYFSSYNSRTIAPAVLTFTPILPQQVNAGQVSSGAVDVTNNGADASGLTAVIQSDGMTGISDQHDIKSGTSLHIPIQIVAKDVPDGPYDVNVFLQYNDNQGSHRTNPQKLSVEVLPNLNFNEVKFPFDIFQPLGKNKIGATDSTSLIFTVQSHSSSQIYRGTYVRLNMSISVPGLAVSPATINIDLIGPNGVSREYNFTISSNHSPPGTYTISIGLYSKDGFLVATSTVTLVITA